MQVIEDKTERSKYEQGRLHITTFGDLGEKQRTYVTDLDNFVAAVKTGTDLVDSGEAHSFAVLRVMHNSLKPGRW